MRKKIYIDIDGVLLDYKTGKAAENAEELIMFLTSGKYDCYWLTTHCKGDTAPTLEYLSGYFSPKIMKRLKRVKATDWRELKTEAIDFDSSFIWLDDYPFQAEVSEMYRHHSFNSLYTVNLNRNGELLNIIRYIKGHGKKRRKAGTADMKSRLFITVAAGLLLLFVTDSMWCIFNRPGDSIQQHVIIPNRGEIYDYRGNLIATNETSDCCATTVPDECKEKSRIYPYGELARRTIGTYRNSDDNCMSGLEGQYDSDLDGTEGIRKVKVGYRFGRLRQRNAGYKKAIDGWDIYTTIDMKYQAVADSVLREAIDADEDIKGGCLILMNVHSGRIKAIANIHRFNDGMTGEYFNYALDYYYEPGEVAQTMTLAAALSDGVVKSLQEKIPTRHGKMNDTAGSVDEQILCYERSHGTDSISIQKGLAMSSKYVFSDIAARYSDTPEYFYEWFKTFSIDNNDYDLHGVRAIRFHERKDSDADMIMSVGQGRMMEVSPLHILTFYNTIAANGKMISPRLIDKMESREFGSQFMTTNDHHGQVIPAETAAIMKEALACCVSDGTVAVLRDCHQFAGKTGTSRITLEPEFREGHIDTYTDNEGKSQYVATCAGFYPATSPKYTIVCALFTKPTDAPLYGGKLPAETIRRFIEEIEEIE